MKAKILKLRTLKRGWCDCNLCDSPHAPNELGYFCWAVHWLCDKCLKKELNQLASEIKCLLEKLEGK